MKIKKIVLAVLIVTTTLSFKDKNPGVTIKSGTYGVCNCGAKSVTKVELTLNPDHTFTYFDNSDPAKLIDLKGNWTQAGETVVLKDYRSGFRIHDKWTLDKNEKCLKSRKGLEFTRLCHIKSCN